MSAARPDSNPFSVDGLTTTYGEILAGQLSETGDPDPAAQRRLSVARRHLADRVAQDCIISGNIPRGSRLIESALLILEGALRETRNQELMDSEPPRDRRPIGYPNRTPLFEDYI